MRTFVKPCLAALLFAATGLSPAMADTAGEIAAPNSVHLTAIQSADVKVGETTPLRTMLSYDHITVSNHELVDISEVSSREFAVHGRMTGTTSVLAYNGDRVVQSFDVKVSPNEATQPIATPAPQVEPASTPLVTQAATQQLELTALPPISASTRTLLQPVGQPTNLIQPASATQTASSVTSMRQEEQPQLATHQAAVVKVGQSEPLRTLLSFDKIAVANEELVDVTPVSSREFVVRGKMAGETNILVYKGGTMVQSFNIEVTQDVAAILSDLNALFPNHRFNVRRISQRMYVEGDVEDETIKNLVLAIVQSHSEGEVISALEVRSPRQVILQVRFLEASRQSIQELGLGNVISRMGDFSFSTSAGLVSGFAPNTSGILNGGSGSVGIDVLVSALEEKGIIRTLAEPNLVATSGQAASFLAGGEFPVPVAAEDNRVTIEFREFGVGLEFTPTVIGRDRVAIRVKPEVSQIDPRNSVRLAGFEIPALIVRKADTHVELRSGQTFAIAGLLQNNYDNEVMQTPFLGDVPILGTLFRSTRFRENETELIILVTPMLLNAWTAEDNPVTDLDAPPPPNAGELLLLGNIEGATAVGGSR